VIEDPEAAAAAWRARHGAIQVNHVLVLKDTVSDAQAGEIAALLEESFAAAGRPEMNPIGLEANRRNLEAAIDCVHGQGMIPRRFTVEELLQ
jgi:4,5-dihydroxyphthalate decarboxylase